MASSSLAFVGCAQTTIGSRFQWRALLRTWLPVLACLMVFAMESTTYLGSDHTSAPLRRMAEALCGYGVDAHWWMIHNFIRKSGHFIGYGFFSLLCFRSFWITLQCAATRLLRQLRAHGLAILATFLVAGADELHQSFLPNRFGQFSDVLLDTFGGLTLCLTLFLVMQLVEWRAQVRLSVVHRCVPDCVGLAAYVE